MSASNSSRSSSAQDSSTASVGRNSLIMASGTAASRITGQLRTILLAAAIGTTGLAANAYQAGSMIPQVIYTLVSGGIFNAVLVPHIVRTLKMKDAEDQLNKIITFAVSLLLGVTVLIGVLTPLITQLYVDGSNPQLIALTTAFTLWCTPQIFFYGLYTVLGQVLAVKNRFGAYAWSSVGANVISIIGFGAFIAIFGNHSQSAVADWNTPKLALTAGAWTLGVAFQALVLFIPLWRLGFRFHLRFGVRGIGLRTMGPIAAWSMGIVVIDQIANIVITRVLTAAPSAAEHLMHLNQFEVAGNATYQNAYTIYILPYSLIAVSVATAIFPQISSAIANHDMDAARTDLSQSLRNVGIIMFFFTAALVVIPLAVTRSLLPTVDVSQALLICGPLVGLSIGLPLSSAYLIIQRTFYAFEDGRSPFTFMLIMYAIQLVLIWLSVRVSAPTQWATVIAFCGPVAYLISFFPLVRMLRRRFEGSLDGRNIAVTYGKAILATIITIVIGLAVRNPVYNWLHVEDPNSHGLSSWIANVAAAAILGVVMFAVYVASLWVLRSSELRIMVASVRRRFSRTSPASQAEQEMPMEPNHHDGYTNAELDDATRVVDADEIMDQTIVTPIVSNVAPSEPLDELEQFSSAVPSELEEAPIVLTGNAPQKPPAPTSVVSKIAQASSMPYGSGEDMRAHLGDTVLNRYTLVSPLREEAGLQAWKANDRVLSRDCQLFIVNNAAVLPSVNAIAGTLAASKDPRFTPVIQLQHDGKIAVVLTQLDAGLSLSEYMRNTSQQAPLSYEAMRTIVAQAANAVRVLQQDVLTHHAISTDTIRITGNGVQLADAAVSEALADTSNGLPNDTDERRAIRQLAAVLYAMLTRTPSTMTPTFTLSALPADTPSELYVIVKRGLELPEDGKPSVPLATLAEFDALLGTVKPFHLLTRHDLRVTATQGNCSIVRAMIKPALPGDVLPIPSSLISSQTLPSIPFAATVRAEDDEDDDESGTETLALGNPASLRALWNQSRAIMEGSANTSGTIPEIQPEDATEMFSAFDPNNPVDPPMQPKRMTVPMDVSAIRHGVSDTTDGAGSSTGRIPVFDDEGTFIEPGNESQRALADEQAAINARYASGTPALPPSFAPQEQETQQDEQSSRLREQQKQRQSGGRRAAIVVCAIALVAALGFAVHSLVTTGSLFGHNTQEQVNWTNNLGDVPFGQRRGSDVKEPESTQTPTQTPTPTQTQKPENTTPYAIANRTFLDRPDGAQGYGYYLQLEKKENVSKIIIKIRSSGGKGYIRVNTPGNPNAGEQVADFTFAEGGTTEVKLNKSVDTQDVMLWVPMDSLPGNQLFIDSMQVL